MFGILIRVLLASTLLALGTGCGGAVFRQPVVTLERVHLAGLGLRGGTLLVDVSIENPNRYALTANQVRYDVEVADFGLDRDTVWIDLATGTHQQRLSVGPGETVSVRVPVEFTYSGLGGAASSLLRAGIFTYRATGAVSVSTPLGTREVPFRHDGTVTLMGSS